MTQSTPPTPTATSPPQQLPYVPRSVGSSVDTQVPVNMQTAVSQALTRLEEAVGPVDEYVADQLNYASPQTLHRYFSAEQIDALALAIHNVQQGKGFVLGDQTGIGKGRVVAGMLRYAKLQGKTPIFITKDTALYADMVRDLNDVNMPGFTPFVTNQNLSALPLPDGRVFKTSPKRHAQIMQEIREKQDLGDHDALFTTYSQLQTVKGRDTPRRNLLRTLAPGSLIILDESHEAGGDANQRRRAGAKNRADFVRELLQEADGVLYSSATYAKRPDVMDLYFKTDMGLALKHQERLAPLVEQGGVPMQQALATMLSQSGQYIRRERSFEGVSFTPEVVPVNQQSAEDVSRIMRSIQDFDTHKQNSLKALNKTLKAEAKALKLDNAVGEVGVSSTNFTSVMHNLLSQMLLSLKAEATVQKSLDCLKRNEKPVLALSNTMGSFIGQYAELRGLQPGEPMDADFSDLLKRYLERSREIRIGDAYGETQRRRLTDEELGEAGVQAYESVLNLIEQADLQAIPVSPIDYITQRLQAEGYSVGEITGREHRVDYSQPDAPTYERRSGPERSKRAAVETVKQFNDGQVDVVLLNRSGSTGISLHASNQFADQRKRHMFVVQPELDINLFMQTLGRVHRTNQVCLPAFSLLMADIPAEKRPGAVLAKKMASLNANTTAARSSGVSMTEMPDFFNPYGDQVVADLMMAYPNLHEQLASPLNGSADALEPEGAVQKVTGRIPLLPLKEQERLYGLIESEYRDLLNRQEALGISILEAQSLDLDARPLAKMTVEPADPGHDSPFTQSVDLEVVDAKIQRRSYTALEAVNRVRHHLGLKQERKLPTAEAFQELQQLGREQTQEQISALHGQVERYRDQLAHTATPAVRTKSRRNLDYQLPRVLQALDEFPVGTPVSLMLQGSEQPLVGLVARVSRSGDERSNPVAPSTWKIQFLVADGLRELTVPLSQLNNASPNALTATPISIQPDALYKAFNQQRRQQREQRQIFTGNLLRAFEKFPNAKVIHYTNAQGQIKTGLLTPQDFQIEAALKQMPISMRSAAEAATVLRQEIGSGRLQTADQLLTIQPHRRSSDPSFVLHTSKAKAVGGRYFLNPALLKATGSEFYSVGERMECVIPNERLEAVLKALMKQTQSQLTAFEQLDDVREALARSLPQLKPVSQAPTQPQTATTVLPSTATAATTHPRAMVRHHQLPFVKATGATEPLPSEPLSRIATASAPISVAQVRDWYRAARDLERGEETLKQIQTLGQRLKTQRQTHQPPEVAAETLNQMKTDLIQYQVLQQRGETLAQAASQILSHIGQPSPDGGRYFQGKDYDLFQMPDALAVFRKQAGERQKILAVRQGKMERTQVTEQDRQRLLQGVQKIESLLKSRQSHQPHHSSKPSL